MLRRFEFSEGTSNKFWQIEVVGSETVVTFGRIGTNGQEKRSAFASQTAAETERDKLIKEKTKKGYTEVTQTPAPPVNIAAVAAWLQAGNASAAPSTPKGPPKAAPKAAPKPKVAPMAAQATTGQIHLSTKEWTRNQNRPWTPATRSKPAKFELDQAMETWAKVYRYGGHPYFYGVKLPTNPSEEAARFWVWLGILPPPKKVDAAEKKKFKTKACTIPTVEEVIELTRERMTEQWQFPEIALPLWVTLGPVGFVKLLRELPRDSKTYQYRNPVEDLWLAFDADIRPYMTEPQRTAIREAIAADVTVKNWSTAEHPDPAFLFAACVGLGDALVPVAEVLTTADHHHRFVWRMLCGLPDPKDTLRHIERLGAAGFRSETEDFAKSLLAVGGTEVLPSLVGLHSRLVAASDDEELLFKALAVVDHPDVTWIALAAHSAESKKRAVEWFNTYPTAAAQGLLARLDSPAAMDQLRKLLRGPNAAVVQAVVDAAPEAVRQAIGDDPDAVPEMTEVPGWLTAALAAAQGKTPAWVQASDLPPVRIGKTRLSDSHVNVLLGSLTKGQKDVATAIKAHAEPTSWDAHLWALFQRWLELGANSKEKWAMGALGFGGDSVALKLTPLIRQWPGESQHPRAVFGLSVLEQIGTDMALMQLNGIAQKVKFKGLQGQAEAAMDKIATARGMTKEELEDRIVPDCDLDEKGTRVFDFGGRKFKFVLGGELKPMVRDEDGKIAGDLPKPNKKDDPDLSAAAVEEWKLLKKQLKEVLKIQSERLEQAMVSGRRWDAAAFETLIVRHPLMLNLGRLVVWGVYDGKNRIASFRISEDGSYANQTDDPTTLPAGTQVGVVHPAELSDAEKADWGTIFSDYQILPPFPQLGRPVYGLQGDEPKAKELTRYVGTKLPPITMVGILDRLRWRRGPVEDGGVFHLHTKTFYAAGVTAILSYECGVPVGYMMDWEDQKLQECVFVEGTNPQLWYWNKKDQIPLSKVHPIVISEVLRDLAVLAEKAQA